MTTQRYGKLRTGRKSYREQIESANAGDRFYAAMAGKPPQAQTVLAPKREYVKREKESGELSELQEQIRAVTWFDKNCHLWNLPPVTLMSIPNGSALTGAITGHNLKRSGMRAGAEDLFLAMPKGCYHGLFVEMKASDGRVDMDQSAMHFMHRRHGYCVQVAWSNEEAKRFIREYLGVTHSTNEQ